MRTSDKIIIGTILTITAAIGIGSCMAVDSANQGAAEKSVEAWAADLRYIVHAKSCTNQDSDGDNYFSCTVDFTDGVGVRHAKEQLECKGKFTLGRGCRDPKLNAKAVR